MKIQLPENGLYQITNADGETIFYCTPNSAASVSLKVSDVENISSEILTKLVSGQQVECNGKVYTVYKDESVIKLTNVANDKITTVTYSISHNADWLTWFNSHFSTDVLYSTENFLFKMLPPEHKGFSWPNLNIYFKLLGERTEKIIMTFYHYLGSSIKYWSQFNLKFNTTLNKVSVNYNNVSGSASDPYSSYSTWFVEFFDDTSLKIRHADVAPWDSIPEYENLSWRTGDDIYAYNKLSGDYLCFHFLKASGEDTLTESEETDLINAFKADLELNHPDTNKSTEYVSTEVTPIGTKLYKHVIACSNGNSNKTFKIYSTDSANKTGSNELTSALDELVNKVCILNDMDTQVIYDEPNSAIMIPDYGQFAMISTDEFTNITDTVTEL